MAGNTTNPASKIQRENTATILNTSGTLYDWMTRSLCLSLEDGVGTNTVPEYSEWELELLTMSARAFAVGGRQWHYGSEGKLDT